MGWQRPNSSVGPEQRTHNPWVVGSSPAQGTTTHAEVHPHPSFRQPRLTNKLATASYREALHAITLP